MTTLELNKIENTLDFLKSAHSAFEDVKSGLSIETVSMKYNIPEEILINIMRISDDISVGKSIRYDNKFIPNGKSTKFTLRFIKAIYPDNKEMILVTIDLIKQIEAIVDYYYFDDMEMDIIVSFILGECTANLLDKKYGKYIGYSKRLYEKYMRVIRNNIKRGVHKLII